MPSFMSGKNIKNNENFSFFLLRQDNECLSMFSLKQIDVKKHFPKSTFSLILIILSDCWVFSFDEIF